MSTLELWDLTICWQVMCLQESQHMLGWLLQLRERTVSPHCSLEPSSAMKMELWLGYTAYTLTGTRDAYLCSHHTQTLLHSHAHSWALTHSCTYTDRLINSLMSSQILTGYSLGLFFCLMPNTCSGTLNKAMGREDREVLLSGKCSRAAIFRVNN